MTRLSLGSSASALIAVLLKSRRAAKMRRRLRHQLPYRDVLAIKLIEIGTIS